MSSIIITRRQFIKSSTVAGVLALIGSSCVMFSRCAQNQEKRDPSYKSPYDFNSLSIKDGRATYYENGSLGSRLGIDVSENQGLIDWNQVHADGIEFAFVRIGYRGSTKGDLYDDKFYIQNIINARNAGLDVGAYFYSQATDENEAKDEAELCIDRLSNISRDLKINGSPLSMPLVFDHEPTANGAGRTDNLSRTDLTNCAIEFCKTIAQSGLRPMIYGNAGDIGRYERERLLSSVSKLGQDKMQVWYAEYNSNKPSAQFDFSIWQYDNQGAVAGINTDVDMNILFTKTYK